MSIIPPGFGTLPETSTHWIPGLILDEGRGCYVKDYPSYVDFYTRKGYAADSPFLEKYRGPWRGGEIKVVSEPTQLSLPTKTGEDATETPLSALIPVGDVVNNPPSAPMDHFPPARTRYQPCEGCDDIRPIGHYAHEDVLLYYPRLAKYLCLQCRQEWNNQTGEKKGVVE